MKYTYKDLIEKATENEYHTVTIDIDNHHIALGHDCGCAKRYWTLYIDGKVICTRCKLDNGIRIAAQYLNEN